MSGDASGLYSALPAAKDEPKSHPSTACVHGATAAADGGRDPAAAAVDATRGTAAAPARSSPRKRPRVEFSHASEEGAPRKREGVTVEVVVARVAKALASPAKFEKALQLLVKLVDSSLANGNGASFVPALEALGDHLPRRPPPGVVEGVRRLFDTLHERKDEFSGIGSAALDGLTLRVRVRCDLLGDDTFAFRTACRRVQGALDTLSGAREDASTTAGEGEVSDGGDDGGGGPTSTSSGRASLEPAVLACLRTALEEYSHQWKRADADALFRRASSLRLRFAPGPREELDDMATELRNRQTKPQARGASAWTELDARQLTHPLRRRMGGAPGAGKS
mmetsp:Transcript_3382/g.10624  ORF Transcript_3382/g.10624 Transcript_3382/m.10624 type:complete len:337 (+) Transcript_3382:255-1265(+)